MSQQSLASKTITKRNVAQSSVIFSVVVAVITLGVIAGVAYLDITENNESVSLEKSIPELIAEQKIRLEENHRDVELQSQAEDLVITLDQRVDDLKQLDEKVKKVNEQLNFMAANLQTETETAETKHKQVNNNVKSVQQVAQQTTNYPINNNNTVNNQQFIKSVFNQNHASKMSSAQQMNAGGEGYLEFSWLFKGRSNMTMNQRTQLQNYLKSQTDWNAKNL